MTADKLQAINTKRLFRSNISIYSWISVKNNKPVLEKINYLINSKKAQRARFIDRNQMTPDKLQVINAKTDIYSFNSKAF